MFTTFDQRRADEYLYVAKEDNPNDNEQLTLTDIFHQFDTVTLRGRTSVDRYLNIQRINEFVDPPQSVPISDRTQLTNVSKENGQTKPIFPTRKTSIKQNADRKL